MRHLCVAALLLTLGSTASFAQGGATALAVSTPTPEDVRSWDQQVDQMLRAGDLRVRQTSRDPLLPGRSHERLDQYVRGVRIVGGDVTRQTDATGTVSVFGMVHSGVDISTTPALSVDAARQAIESAAGGDVLGGDPELVILPLSDAYHLAYYARAATPTDQVSVFVDAGTGAVLRRYSEFISDIVPGKGVYGDDKKLSVLPSGGSEIATDALRPTTITTYDMKGDFTRTINVLNFVTPLVNSDIASNTGPTWADPVVVDAHAYAGWYYDYLFKRFNRLGIDDNNLRIAVLTHPVSLSDIATAPAGVVGEFYINAFFCSTCGPNRRGAVTLGEGAPKGFLAPGLEVKPFAAAFDVVAHELTHAVTASTARLNGFTFSEAGALNEAFSDVIGVSAAFFQEPAGNTPMHASYVQGRDLTVPAGAIGRNLANPSLSGDPDHYSRRIIGGDPHYNGVILGHAFYLAIEGGTNRTSGLSVQGVGGANRDQIEKSFFRALTLLLPSNATFALARDTTIQAARDLYGAGSPAERAITQAWDAVGVQDRTAPSAVMLPNPATSTSGLCNGVSPSWTLGVTFSAATSNLSIGGWSIDTYDANGALISGDSRSASAFASSFNVCGPGSSSVRAQTDACAVICVALGGRTNGGAQVSFTTSAGTVTTPRVSLTKSP
ncbi:MAG TPA: M4 family metallopeptidase [Vicinamibacterales bacterium]|nr:M4 family metallopeptidase [Vicinamibacterales bacterium]